MVRSSASGEVPTRRTAWVPCQPWMQHHLDPRRRSTSPPTPPVVPLAPSTPAPTAAPAVRAPGGPGPTDAGAGRPAVTPGDPEGKPFSPVLRVLLVIGAVVAIGGRPRAPLLDPSDLWLDEALTVNIAGVPLHEIPSYLKRDGAPPLFYVLLHFWMERVRDVGRRGAGPSRGVRRGDAAAGLARRPAARRPHRRLGRPAARGHVARSPSATTPRPACTRWSPC